MRNSSIVFVAAPVCLFFYGVFWLLDGRQGFHGPGIFWSVGHVFFLLAFIFFGFAVWNLQGRLSEGAGRHVALVSAAVAYLGIAVFLRVGLIDLITGFMAVDHASMGAISGRLNAWPSARLMPWFRLGPLLFQVGWMAQLVQLAWLRRVPWWSPVMVLCGFLLVGYDLRLLMPGAILMGLGLAALLREERFKGEASGPA